MEKDFTKYFKLLTFQKNRLSGASVLRWHALDNSQGMLVGWVKISRTFSSWEAEGFMQMLTQDPPEQELIIVLNKLIGENLLAIWNVVDF